MGLVRPKHSAMFLVCQVALSQSGVRPSPMKNVKMVVDKVNSDFVFFREVKDRYDHILEICQGEVKKQVFFNPSSSLGEGRQNKDFSRTEMRPAFTAWISLHPGRLLTMVGSIFSVLTPTQTRQICSGFRFFTSFQSVWILAASISAKTFVPPASALISVSQFVPPGVNTGFGHHSQ